MSDEKFSPNDVEAIKTEVDICLSMLKLNLAAPPPKLTLIVMHSGFPDGFMLATDNSFEEIEDVIRRAKQPGREVPAPRYRGDSDEKS